METFLVGGAVRDRLLGLPVRERDWVVVGATPDEMVRLGFRAVGRDFPVFLHPHTGEEYALARTERKTGRGHTGFECDIQAVTLEQDLSRRDLTINAIAEDGAGNLIDPVGGVTDLNNRILRHVSEAFAEDPLRVLRVARFAARLARFKFVVHTSTFALMREMTAAGALSELTPERVFQELDKALKTDQPQVFFSTLEYIGAGAVLWPEIDAEGIRRLELVAGRVEGIKPRFAALVSGISAANLESLTRRLKLPRRVQEFAALAQRYLPAWREQAGLNPRDTVELLYALDAFRQPERFLELNLAFGHIAAADNPGLGDIGTKWRRSFARANEVTIDDVERGLAGEAISDAIRQLRIERVAAG